MKDQISISTGKILKKCRKQAGYTMLEVATKCGKTKSWLADIESGRSEISFRHIRQVLKMYNMDINIFSYLVEEDLKAEFKDVMVKELGNK